MVLQIIRKLNGVKILKENVTLTFRKLRSPSRTKLKIGGAVTQK